MKPIDKVRIEAITRHTKENPSLLVGVTVDVERKDEWRTMLTDIEGLTILDESEVRLKEDVSIYLFRVTRMPDYHKRRLKAGLN